MPETDPNNHCHLFPLTIIFCASSIANVSALWHGDLPSTCLVSSGISKDEKVFVARGIKKLNTMCESINVRFMNEVDAGYCAGVLYASTRVTFHFVLRHSRHLSVIPVTSPSPPSLYFTYRSLSFFIVSPSFVFRLSSIPSLRIYSAPVMFRASFLGFVAALSYFNIFTFLWLDNKFIVFMILWLNYLVVLRYFT